jgi:hypothetical protein
MLQRGTRRPCLSPLLEHAKLSAVAVLSHHVAADHKKRREESKEHKSTQADLNEAVGAVDIFAPAPLWGGLCCVRGFHPASFERRKK